MLSLHLSSSSPFSPRPFSLSAAQVDHFVSCTGLVNLSSASDADLEALLSHPRLRVCTWDSTLSLAHPTVCAVLDDFDERMERFVKFYKLHDPQVAAIEARTRRHGQR